VKQNNIFMHAYCSQLAAGVYIQNAKKIEQCQYEGARHLLQMGCRVSAIKLGKQVIQLTICATSINPIPASYLPLPIH
jgi:hypothetical protein